MGKLLRKIISISLMFVLVLCTCFTVVDNTTINSQASMSVFGVTNPDFSATVLSGATANVVSISMTKGDTIWVAMSKSPSSTLKYGIKNASGANTYASSASFEYTAKTTGTHRIFITNSSSSSVKISGAYEIY